MVYHLASLDKGHRFRVKVPVDEDDPQRTDGLRHLEGGRLVRARGLGPDGHPLRRPPQPASHPDPRGIPGTPSAQGLRPRETLDSDRGRDHGSRLGHRDRDDEDQFETQILNIGPSHPATHGTLRIVARLDGEVITKAECEIGYLHRCFEKMSETHGWNEVIPYTDRLNYCSSMINGVGYALGVEKMLGIEAPPRAQVVRVILSEFSRIMDHAVCLGANLVDLGALTNFWYFFQPREEIYALLEACAGGRLTVSYARIGGLAHDVPADFEEQVRYLLGYIPKFIDDVDQLVTTNRIFRDRTEGVGLMSAEEALAWGWTGPCLRASGVPYDLRRASPISATRSTTSTSRSPSTGDCYARYLVRIEEMRQSLRIIEQAIDNSPRRTGDHRQPPCGTAAEIQGLLGDGSR